MKRIISLILILIFLQGSACNNSDFTFSGEMGSVSDAKLVDCDAYLDEASKNHQCLLLANPQLGILRVFDVTDNQFILSPIGYFPLAVKAGVAPSRIATNKNTPGKAFVLDTAGSQIVTISTKNEGQVPSFVSNSNQKKISVDAGSNFIVVAKKNDQSFAYVAKGGNQIDVFDLDSKVKEPLSISFSGNWTIQDVTISASLNAIAVAALEGLTLINIENGQRTNIANDSLGKVTIGTVKVNIEKTDLERTLLLGLSKTENNAYLYFLKQDGSFYKRYSVELDGIPLAGYIPEGTRNNCCDKNNPEPWVAVLTATGNLQYLKIADIIRGTKKKVKEKDVSGNEIEVEKSDFIGATVHMGERLGVTPDKTAGAVAIVGVETVDADKKSKVRKMLLVFSGLLASVIEGEHENIKRLDAK